MSERYGKLFSLPENLYTEGSPVVIAAGALLKDNQTGKILAQLKIQNIASKKIKAATVCIQPLDTVGNALGDTVTYQYLDLCADRDSEFGQKTPIALPNAATRSFQVFVTEVIFEDNTTWTQDSHPWEPLKRAQTLSVLRDNELEKQFRMDYGWNCANLLLEQKDLWHCICGAVNHQGEANCHKCRKAFADLKAIDMDSLRVRKAERVAQEKADAEAAQLEAQKQAKIFKKNAIRVGIIAACIAVVVIAAMLISDMVAYNSAVALMESGQYAEAIAAFEAMDGYRDSAEQIVACETAITDAKYQNAVALLEAGQYEEAIMAFEALNDYKDSAEQITECQYRSAIELLENEHYEEAITALEVLGTFRDSEEKKTEAAYQQEQIDLENAYQRAFALNNSGEKAKAAIAFGKLGDFRDSRAQSMELWIEIAVRQKISAGDDYTIGLKSDGTVVAAGEDAYKEGHCIVSDWSDIVAVSAGDDCSIGLKSDGTVVAVGSNSYRQFNVSEWTDIVAISAGDDHMVGLKSDGTVVAVGSNSYKQCNVSEWTDIVAISAGSPYTVGLKTDGTVAITDHNNGWVHKNNIYAWSDIVAISAGGGYIVGLKLDGTVVAEGINTDRQCNVKNWTDVVAISAGSGHTVGLKSDGTVVATGNNEYRQCDVSSWTDIVAISAGRWYTIGLKSDGTVVATGWNRLGQCNVSDWTDIKLP